MAGWLRRFSPISPMARGCFLLSLLLPVGLAAEGFRNSAPGVYGLGQSGGRMAFIDDASAAAHNPANLTELSYEGRGAYLLTPTFVHTESDFKVDGGARARTAEPVKILPNFFAAFPGPNERLAFGLSVTVPFGLATEWETNGPFGPGGALRYLTPFESEMLTARINPVVAYQVNDRLSLAFGLSALYSELRFKQYFPRVPSLVASETVAEAEMDGWGIGANAALRWDMSERNRLTVTMRSETTIDHDGDSRLGALTPTALAMGFTENGSAGTRVTYPWIVGVAFGRELTEQLRIEAQYERVGFSGFEELNIDLGSNNPLFGGANITPQDWEDSHTFGLGLRYDHGGGWRTHASCQYFESPVPDETLSTTIPDADQLAYTVGFTKRWDRGSVGLAYSYVDYDERRADISGVTGKLETRLHLLSLNLGWRF